MSVLGDRKWDVRAVGSCERWMGGWVNIRAMFLFGRQIDRCTDGLIEGWMNGWVARRGGDCGKVEVVDRAV